MCMLQLVHLYIILGCAVSSICIYSLFFMFCNTLDEGDVHRLSLESVAIKYQPVSMVFV